MESDDTNRSLAATIRPDRYRELKQTVREGLTTFIDVGLALIEIREGQGYLFDRYETFEDFCRGEFDLAVNRAYQLIDGSRISTTVDKAGLPTPTAERQARELVPLLPPDPARDVRGRQPEWRPETDEHLIETWRFVAEENDEPVTAKVVKKWVRHKLAEIRPEQDSPDLPTGIFSTIVADPPWPMEKIQREVHPEQYNIDYPTMSVQAIKDMAPEIMSRSADDAHLYLWTTQRFLPDALEIVKEWGFKYQCLLTWVKNVGFTPFSWMYTTEHVVFARRGNLPLLKNGLRLDFQAKRTRHSEKPEVFYDLVTEASPEPRLELFARQPRDGFEVWGNDPNVQ